MGPSGWVRSMSRRSMWVRSTTLFLATLISLALSRSARAELQSTRESHVIHRQLHADMDGDHKTDLIQATFYSTSDGPYDRAVVEINGASFVVHGEVLHGDIFVVDIDTTDAAREVAVPEAGPSDDPATHFLRYSLGEVIELGVVPGITTGPQAVDGSGSITTQCRGEILETWWYPCRFSLNRWKHVLEEESQERMPMDTRVTLKCDLRLVADAWSTEPAAVLHKGDRATLRSTDNKNWCYIESERGVRGWFAVYTYGIIAQNGLPATEVFDGLFIAD